MWTAKLTDQLYRKIRVKRIKFLQCFSVEISGRLYEYARQGIEVPRNLAKSPFMILSCIVLKVMKLEWKHIAQKVPTSITIVDDLGEMLGCGAHVPCCVVWCCESIRMKNGDARAAQ